jgi:hypothetical protein
MSKIISIILSATIFLAMSNSALAENILSKTDADNIFGMRKAEWEKTAPRYAHPNGKVKLKKMDTGVVVAVFDSSTGYGLSIQPIYLDTKSGPSSLIVGSFYPMGTMTSNFSDIQKEVEADSEKDLGPEYKVSAKYVNVTSKIEEIELTITRKSKTITDNKD